METTEDSFAKQYDRESMNENMNASNIIVNLSNRPKKDYYHLIHPYAKPIYHQKTNEEPIDLTQGHHRVFKEERVGVNPSKYYGKSRGRRPKIYYQNNLRPENMPNFAEVLDIQTTENKQAEILKAAKSLFSKRTRTLYHWMYPNTPKQQIKMAVANSWDNLGTQEKQFYISQVLVKFGFPQCSLMVNPQVGGMQHLPSLPTSIDGNNYASRELQTAISSISPETSSTTAAGKRRQGRPPGSKNKKPKNELFTYKITKDFQDDPELSNELEKFAISFDCFK